MSRLYYERIISCYHCPNERHVLFGMTWYCKEAQMRIYDRFDIPIFCPLPNMDELDAKLVEQKLKELHQTNTGQKIMRRKEERER